jgi:uncharacterized protein YccT (UPF0319 family)
MPDKKVILVRFYPEADADLIKWLESLVAGDRNDTIKSMVRVGIAVSQSGNSQAIISGVPVATFDPANLQSALECFLPRIREIVDASLASAHFTPAGNDVASKDENMASPDLLKGHILSDDEDE